MGKKQEKQEELLGERGEETPKAIPVVAVPEPALPARLAPQEAALMSGFEASAVPDTIAQDGGALAQVAREEAEIKAAMVVAIRRPRDEQKAYTRMMQSCQRPAFAEKALYRFERGRATVEGPSVGLAREIARCWGNVRYGLRIVAEDEERVHVKGYAHDLETNAYVEAEDKFAKKIFRKAKGWVVPDERDLRELINRRGAICIRNAILQIIPVDLVEDAAETVKKTIDAAARGDIKQDRTQAIRRLALAYAEFGVMTEHLAIHLGHPLESINEDELASLRKIYRSIRDGNSKREEHFDFSETRALEPTGGERRKVGE